MNELVIGSTAGPGPTANTYVVRMLLMLGMSYSKAPAWSDSALLEHIEGHEVKPVDKTRLFKISEPLWTAPSSARKDF